MPLSDPELQQWYVLSSSDSVKSLEQQFDALSALRVRRGAHAVEYFLPTCIIQTSLFGKPSARRKKMVENYVFVRDTHVGVLEIRESIKSLWILPHPDKSQVTHRYMTIGDKEMDLFKAIAKAYDNELPCYPMDAVDLEDGDKVEIVGGEFDGMTGTLRCSQGRDGGKVLMPIGNLFVVATPAIRPQYIRILQFGKGNRHPYRQFEAHLARAMQALRHLRGDGASPGMLTVDDVAAMTMFTGRFEALQPATVNIASQHATLMLMSYSALGDTTMAARWRTRCILLLSKIKSDIQRAWQLTFMYAATGDTSLRQQAQSIVTRWPLANPLHPSDRKRALILTTLTEFT